MDDYDVIIVGSGAGGGTLARHLAPSGKRILLLERGDWLPREPANWLAQDVFVENKYISPDTWYDGDGKAFQPQVHYFVGGATKLYGAALYRLRAGDFGELRHHDGISPAWPISYDELEPYYSLAEQLYEVHGARGEDPTEGPASAPYPFPAVVARAAHPAAPRRSRGGRLPAVPRAVRCAVNEANMPYSACVRCANCDGFVCAVHGKSDAEVLGVRPALEHPNVDAGDERACDTARHRRWGRTVTEVCSSTARRRRASPPTSSCSPWGREHGQAAPALAQREASGRARERLRPGRAQLHVPQQRRRARALEGREPDGVPEDARAERLLLRLEGARLPARQHADGRQVAGADVPR